jgi:hypothetical protein
VSFIKRRRVKIADPAKGIIVYKKAQIANVKRQSDILTAYNSAGEIEFNRTLGITLQKNNLETTAFGGVQENGCFFK